MKITGLPLVCGVFAFFSGSATLAEEWRGLGPDGGDMVRVLADPLVAGRAYAVGPQGMARTSNAGASWAAVGAGQAVFSTATSWGFAADTQVQDRLYFIDYTGRVLRSDNAALSWSATGYTVPDFSVPGLLPNWTTLTAVPGAAGSLVLTLHDGFVLKSIDAGASFAVLSPQFAFQHRAVASLAIDPANPQHMLAALGYMDNDVGSVATLQRSTDGGANWSPVIGAPTLGEGTFVAFHSQQRATAVLNGVLYFSTDNGQNWQPHGTVSYYGSTVVETPVGPQRLILKSDQACISFTNDFANSESCENGCPAGATAWHAAAVRDGALGFRLIAAASGQGTVAYFPETNRWETRNRGLQIAPVRGLALQPGDSRRLFVGNAVNDLRPELNRLFASSDGGQSWDGRINFLARYMRGVEIDPTTASEPGTTVMYAAGTTQRRTGQPFNSGIYKSSDGGVAWVPLDSGFPPYNGSNGGVQVYSVRQVKLDPRSCAQPPAQGPCRQGPLNTIYAVTSGSGSGHTLYKSVQGGSTWQPASDGLPTTIEDAQGIESLQPIDLEIDPFNGDLFLSAFCDYYNDDNSPRVPVIRCGVFRSSDGGANWQHRSNGLPLVAGSATTNLDVLALALHPRRAGVLWAAVTALTAGDSSSTIYRSTDAGASWAPLSAPLAGCIVRDLQVDGAAPDVIYAAGSGVAGGIGCVLRSEDGGSSWTPLGVGLPLTWIYDLRQDPADRRRIVLASDRGVWEGMAPSDRIFTDTAR